jgi:magnesium transporter
MHVLTALDRDQIAGLLERDEFFWLDLHVPSDEQFEQLEELLSLHPIALESLREYQQRPKLDSYERYVVLVFYGVDGTDRAPLDLLEVHMLISGSYIVTVHHQLCDELDGLRDRFERHPEGSEQFIVYKVLDVLADSFFPALETMDEEIDALEDKVISHADEQQLQRIFELKKELVGLRRIVTPQRDLLARAIDEISDLPGFEAGKRDYFRDVYDHMIRVSDLIDSYRDLLTGSLDVYLSTVSNRLNAVMERLTIVATIFLPLTFLTGFFGQNFGWMVGHVSSFADFMIFGVGGVALTVALLLALFRRAGYIGASTPRG